MYKQNVPFNQRTQLGKLYQLKLPTSLEWKTSLHTSKTPHNRLKRIVGKPHPNVYEIVEVFQKEQLSVEVSLAQLAVGVRPPRRAKKTIEKERKLAELKERFQDQAISLHDYVAGVSAHSM